MSSSSRSSSSSVTTAAEFVTNSAEINGYNLGPITSVFTAPTSCLSTLTWGQDMYMGHRNVFYYDPACYPSSTNTIAVSNWRVYYYSPAICPTSWSHATTITSTFGNDDVGLSIGDDTTAVVCCPTGYIYAGSAHACQSVLISTRAVLTYKWLTQDANDVWRTNASQPVTSYTISDSTYNVYADGIPVWWQSSDLAAFAQAPVTTSDSASTATNTLPTSTSTSTSEPSPSSSSGGISTGAKIGIGIGVPIVVIALFIAGFFIYRRRNRGTRPSEVEANSSAMEEMNKVPHTPGELPVDERPMELYSDHAPYDDGRQNRYELPAR